MKIGDITEFGEVSFIDFDKCFVQFSEPGSKGIHGVFSMTDEAICKEKYNKALNSERE